MKKFLAILVCKLGRFVGKLVGRGSSLPGQYALKICPDILRQVTLPRYIIAVTGSNGKTSTVEMIAAILRAEGKNVVYNEEGSNQIEGVTTTVLTHSTFGGVMKADVLLIESDERYAAHSFQFFHPTHFVVTNLDRDQLTRNGHPEWVFDALKPAMFPETRLILNADDPLSASFALDRDNVRWFGLDRCSISTEEPSGVYRDGAYCPICKSPMEYRYYHFNHIGSYHCPSCEFAKPVRVDYTATALNLEAGVLTIDEELTIHLAFRSIYNVYNILAAYAVCRECGVSAEHIGKVVNNYILKNGRMVRFLLGAHHGMLLTSKHENSIAYDTNLRYVRSTEDPCTVVVIVDAVSRKYYTSETSWLWDIDFDQLNSEHVQKVLLCGQYASDLAVRFSFTDVPQEKIELHPDITEACNSLKAGGAEDVYVLTCFSDRDKLLSLVEKEAV
ncbi:MAG: MurT ligase domain-containing protein [Oscillibacter sp.]|nr:MurT ligase domain-containing protein [Oscillibacter sp.]